MFHISKRISAIAKCNVCFENRAIYLNDIQYCLSVIFLFRSFAHHVHWSGRLQKCSIFESKTVVVSVFRIIILRLSFVLERQRLKATKNSFQLSTWNENALEQRRFFFRFIFFSVLFGCRCWLAVVVTIRQNENKMPNWQKERKREE